MSLHDPNGPISMNENELTPTVERLYRLIELTQAGGLDWTFLYPSQTHFPDDHNESISSLTEPVAYVVEDEMHGFGVTVLRLRDTDNESDDPILFIQGEAIDRPVNVLRMLLDAVRMFVEGRQRGETPTPAENTAHFLQGIVDPLYEDVYNINQTIEILAQSHSQLLRTVDNLVDAVNTSQQITLLSMTNGNNKPEDTNKIPLTTHTLKACLRRMVGENQMQQFRHLFNDQLCHGAVQEVSEAYRNATQSLKHQQMK